MAIEEITEDSLLGGQIKLRQPKNGYRAAIDPVFLAASIPACAGETALDLGAGVGAASLCLARRVLGCKTTGLEVQRDLVRLCADNIELNNLRDRAEILNGDLLKPPPRLAPSLFSHVMANPPYYEKGRVSPYVNVVKEISHVEALADLKSWLDFALLMVRPKGTVSFIYTANRLDEILSLFYGRLGDIIIFPLWPGEGKPAKRVIIRGIKNAQGGATLARGLVLHQEDGRYTPQAEEVLRHGGPLHL